MRNLQELPLAIYDTRGFELGKEVQAEVKKEVMETINKGLATQDINKATEMIMLEVPMSHYLQGARDKADIIIHTFMNNNMIRALAVVECKKEDVVLSDKVVEQVVNYADIVGANYFIVTNGIDIKRLSMMKKKICRGNSCPDVKFRFLIVFSTFLMYSIWM